MGTQRLTADSVEALPLDGKDRLYFDDLVKGFGVRVTAAGTKIFIAQRRISGQPVRVSIGKVSELSVAKAREKARSVLNTMGEGKDPRSVIEPSTEPETPAKTLSDVIDEWLEEHVRVKLKPRTVEDYEKIAGVLKAEFGNKPITDITKADVRKFHAKKANTPRRANYYIQVLGAVLNFAEMSPNPAKKIVRYREGTHQRILSQDEQQRVFAAINALEAEEKLSVWACGALRFAILTGARPSEIRAIEWKHLDMDRKRVVLPDSKANRTRIIYTKTAAWGILTAMPKFGKYVFAGRTRNTPYQNLTRAWIDVRKVAKLPDVRLYDCRHSFASEAALAGHNLPMIGTLLGHTVPATTQRYVHLVNDPAAAASQDVGDRMAALMEGK